MVDELCEYALCILETQQGKFTNSLLNNMLTVASKSELPAIG